MDRKLTYPSATELDPLGALHGSVPLGYRVVLDETVGALERDLR